MMSGLLAVKTTILMDTTLTPTRETFLQLPANEIARTLRGLGGRVICFPINGTRRWFALEHGDQTQGNYLAEYMRVSGLRHIAIYKMLFDHGLDTILAPMFGSELLDRGEDYVERIGLEGLTYLATNPDFLAFYHEYEVRVRFYGDYHRQLANTPLAFLAEAFDRLAGHTRRHERFRLFYGVFANDPAEQVAGIGARNFQQHGRPPTRDEIVAAYYGEPVAPVDLFIGFDKLSAFDYPLLNLGNEDLYFTAAPSLYLTEGQLRTILFDHLYTRRVPEPDYEAMTSEQRAEIKSYYADHREKTLGVGLLRGGMWHPD
jgi:adenosine tuberculosinyltransferase